VPVRLTLFVLSQGGFYQLSPDPLQLRAYRAVDGTPGTLAGTFGRGSYILAWEAEIGGGNQNFNAFVVEMMGISPIPEPATVNLLLIGLVIAVMVQIARRRRRHRA
jgi:hypothetical protein